VAVRGELDAILEPAGHVLHELGRAGGISSADVEGRNQLGVRVDRDPRPHGADALLAPFRSNVLLLGANEAPDFVALDTPAGQVPQRLVLIVTAGPAGIREQLRDRVLAESGQARDRPDGHALDHHPEDLGAFAAVQPLHTDLYA
jgi:hypothetical protein